MEPEVKVENSIDQKRLSAKKVLAKQKLLNNSPSYGTLSSSGDAETIMFSNGKSESAPLGTAEKFSFIQSDNVFDTYLSNGVGSGSSLNPLMKWVRDLGMEGCICYNKFTPEQYLGSSDETHIELLKGLIGD